jgi:hypothetical protein
MAYGEWLLSSLVALSAGAGRASPGSLKPPRTTTTSPVPRPRLKTTVVSNARAVRVHRMGPAEPVLGWGVVATAGRVRSPCPAGADDSDAVRTALREHYREDPAVNRETEEHESRLAVRIAGIVEDSAERVGEQGHRLFESYAVPRQIRRLLSGVPLEDGGHDCPFHRDEAVQQNDLGCGFLVMNRERHLAMFDASPSERLLLYTIFSHGRALGTTDLGFVYRAGGFRSGWLHPTPLGERYLPIAAGVAPAMRAEYLLGPDPTLRADVLAANDQAEALSLELRREDGVLIDTSDIGISDTEYLLSVAAAAEHENEDWELSADDEAEIAELVAGLEEEPWATSVAQEDTTAFQRYQVQVQLIDPSDVP